MAFPTLRSGQQTIVGGNTTTHNILLPPTIEAGDLLLVFISFDGNPTVTWDQSTAGTWTLVYDTANGADNKGVCYKKIADGTEDALTLAIGTSASEQSVARAVAYQDWGGTLTDIVAATPATGTSANPSLGSTLSPGWGAVDIAWIVVVHTDFSRSVSTYPTGFTINQFSDTSGGGAGCMLGTAKRELTAASLLPGDWTINSSDQWVTTLIAIRPVTANIFVIVTEDGDEIL